MKDKKKKFKPGEPRLATVSKPNHRAPSTAVKRQTATGIAIRGNIIILILYPIVY